MKVDQMEMHLVFLLVILMVSQMVPLLGLQKGIWMENLMGYHLALCLELQMDCCLGQDLQMDW
jgi:hypothetical protein